MKLNELKTYLKIKGGATLTKKSKLLNNNNGYMVSLEGNELKTNINDLTVKTLIKYKRLAKKLNAYIGLWLEDNTLYIDLSIKIETLKEAKALGRRNNQLAIYDLEKQETIYL